MFQNISHEIFDKKLKRIRHETLQSDTGSNARDFVQQKHCQLSQTLVNTAQHISANSSWIQCFFHFLSFSLALTHHFSSVQLETLTLK